MTNLILILFLFFLLWLIVISYYLYKLINRYNRLTYGIQKKNLTDVIDKILSDVQSTKHDLSRLDGKVEEITEAGKSHVQKVGIVRFNPFPDTGGSQSFVIALLDEKDNGIVLTSLHTRSVTRWYVKKVKEGKGENQELSQEEQKAIKNSQKGTK